jgi:hypothetical protein
MKTSKKKEERKRQVADRSHAERCRVCGRPATRFGPDPYSSEIRGNYEHTELCDKCYKDSCDDI